VFADQFAGCSIGELRMPFAAVATELDTGRETWLQDGSLVDAVRASIAIPGIFTPQWHDGVWLVDGGLSNPVPVSVARGMRADCVIAIDLNNDILNGRDLGGVTAETPAPIAARAAAVAPVPQETDGSATSSDAAPLALRRNGKPWPRWLQPAPGYEESRDVRVAPAPSARVPSMLSSIAQSIDIMQVRITRSRLAGEPADILIQPRLGGMGIFDFHRARPAIEEGRAAVQAMMPAILARLGMD
jgi:NTE family protein